MIANTPVTFAGFEYPKYLGHMPKGSLAKRLDEYKKGKARGGGTYKSFTSGYYQNDPSPLTGGKDNGRMFYLDGDFMPNMRWEWCDKVEGVGRRIDHTGWFGNDEGWGDTMRGIVFRLNRGRGFLAGWSYNAEGMLGELEYRIYETEREAAYAADQIAERVAEKEREYQTEEDERRLAEEKEEEEKQEQADMVIRHLESAGWTN
jgi:hypothetical protein